MVQTVMDFRSHLGREQQLGITLSLGRSGERREQLDLALWVHAAYAKPPQPAAGRAGRGRMIEDMGDLHSSEADRRELHALVDHIPASDLPAARKILRALADPVWQSILEAQIDDEPETEEERVEVEAARSEKGSGTPHEKMLREFGL